MLHVVLSERELAPGSPVAGRISVFETRAIDSLAIQLVRRETTLGDSSRRRMQAEKVLAERPVCGAGTAHAGTSMPVEATLPADLTPSAITQHGRHDYLIRAVASTSDGEVSSDTPIAVTGGAPDVGAVQAHQRGSAVTFNAVMAVVGVVLGIVAIVVGITAMAHPPDAGRAAGALPIALGVALLTWPLIGVRRTGMRRRARVSIDVTPAVVRRGNSIDVHVTHNDTADLVARYSVIEHYGEAAGAMLNGRRRANMLTFDHYHEITQLPTGDDHLRFVVPTTVPPTLAGELLRVVHTVEVLPIRSATSRMRAMSRRAHVDVVVAP